MLLSFSEKGPTTTRAPKTKLLFKSLGKSSGRKSVLGLSFTICTTKGKFAIATKQLS